MRGRLLLGFSLVFISLAVAAVGQFEELRAPRYDDIIKRFQRYAQAPVSQRADYAQEEISLIPWFQNALRQIDEIYMQQASAEGPDLRHKLRSAGVELQFLGEFIGHNYGPFDRADGEKLLLGPGIRPPGANLYPTDLQHAEFENYLAANSRAHDLLGSPYTVVKRDRRGGLFAVPYEEEYRVDLELAFKALAEACALTDNPSLRRYLALRAYALRNGNYKESHMAWLDLKETRLDLTIGPFFMTEDKLAGLKAVYGAAITLRDEERTRKLEPFAAELKELAAKLPGKIKARAEEVKLEAVKVFQVGGALNTTFKPVGSCIYLDFEAPAKRQVYINLIDAKLQRVLLPLAKEAMAGTVELTSEDLITVQLLHQLAHQLSVGRPEPRRALRLYHSVLEEAKADILGLYFIKHFMDKGLIESKRRDPLCAAYLAWTLHAARFGNAYPQGSAALVQLGYLMEQKAVALNRGRFSIDPLRAQRAAATLAGRLLEIEAAGDFKRAEKLVDAYGKLRPDAAARLAELKAPVDLRLYYVN